MHFVWRRGFVQEAKNQNLVFFNKKKSILSYVLLADRVCEVTLDDRANIWLGLCSLTTERKRTSVWHHTELICSHFGFQMNRRKLVFFFLKSYLPKSTLLSTSWDFSFNRTAEASLLDSGSHLKSLSGECCSYLPKVYGTELRVTGHSKDLLHSQWPTIQEARRVFTHEMTNCLCRLKWRTRHWGVGGWRGSVMTCGYGCPFIPWDSLCLIS